MLLTQVKFFSEEEACAMRGNAFTGMISITGDDPWHVGKPHDAPLQDGWGYVLRLRFDDIAGPRDGWRMFSVEDARIIINWVEEHADQVKAIFVHCFAGQSRSAAVAKYIANKYKLPFDMNLGRFYNRLVFDMLVENDPNFFRD